MRKKVLSQLVEQFKTRHARLPDEIVVHPVALAALALRQSVAPKWNGIPVRCRDVKPITKPVGNRMGVTIIKGALRCFDL
jgi:hypothetical protein